MNLLKLMQSLDLSKIDQEEFLKPALRRQLFKKAGDFSLKAALTSAPIATMAFPKIVKAQSSIVVETLNFALTLEYLEDEFYKMGLAASNLIPVEDRTIFMQIGKHETAHVNFLKTALGESAVAMPTFDFTAGGAFADAFSNYATFLALSQSFEDTGVRAYKGQAGNLLNDNDTLTAALQIHSVEARHASEVRRLRGKASNMAIKGWITNDESNGAPAAIYEGEDNTTHAGADISTLSTLSDISMAGKTESFDEPLTKEQVLAIVDPFIA
ncbi:MAG TPA: ferritin-like domain-containing protein [Cytophagales bacterium]|nr:ferritin-like domain-containing protein [Cytophagales bacterium]